MSQDSIYKRDFLHLRVSILARNQASHLYRPHISLLVSPFPTGGTRPREETGREGLTLGIPQHDIFLIRTN